MKQRNLRFIVIVLAWTTIISGANFMTMHRMSLYESPYMMNILQILAIVLSSALGAYLMMSMKQALAGMVAAMILSSLILFKLMMLPVDLGIIYTGAAVQRAALSIISVRMFFSLVPILVGTLAGGMMGD